jgi:hypothetical protein
MSIHDVARRSRGVHTHSRDSRQAGPDEPRRARGGRLRSRNHADLAGIARQPRSGCVLGRPELN